MKTTLILDDEVHRRAKEASARLGIPLTKFIEDAIRLKIDTESTRRTVAIPRLPLSKEKGGLRPGINLDDTAELLNLLDQAIEPDKLRS
jgi:hypothetical protein